MKQIKKLRELYKSKEHISESDINTGIRMYVLDGICSTAMTTLQGGVYLSAYALLIGASQKQIGIIASIGFISQLMQLMGLFILTKYKNRKVIVTVVAAISRILWIPIILLTLTGFKEVNTFLLVLLAISLFGAMGGPSFNSILRDIFPQEKMGFINGKRLLSCTATGLIFMLIGGYFIDSWIKMFPAKATWSYGILFTLGMLFGLYGISALARIPHTEMGDIEPSIIKLITSAWTRIIKTHHHQLFIAIKEC